MQPSGLDGVGFGVVKILLKALPHSLPSLVPWATSSSWHIADRNKSSHTQKPKPVLLLLLITTLEWSAVMLASKQR